MGFLPVQGEGVSGEEVVGNGVHPSKRFNGIGDDGYIVTVSPRGETGGGMGTGGVCRGYKVSSCGSESFVEFIHDHNEKERGKGTSLFYTFRHEDFARGSGRIEFHGKSGAVVSVHD